MTTPIPVMLDPSARPSGLLSVLRSLPPGWERGVDVLPGSTLAPDRVGPCATPSGDPESPGEVERFLAVQIRQGVECTALGNGRDLTIRYAENSIGVTFAFALSAELVTGSATNNPSLSDATDVGDATDPVDAICQLEAALETRLYGRLGVIHVPLGHACALGDTLVQGRYEGRDVWRTYAGNLVAIHGTGDVLYGTGEVWGAWRVGDDTNSYVDHAVNRVQAWSSAVAIAVFDPAVNVSVNISG